MTAAGPALVSVIVPVFNVERYLDTCLASIRCQTYPNLQIILVEDCATDASLAVAQGHLGDARVQILRHDRNLGLSAARNTGIAAATGHFIMFVDSDDIIAPTLVQTCLDAMRRDDLAVVLYGFTAFTDGDNPRRDPADHDRPAPRAVPFKGTAYFKYPHFAWLKMIRADILDDVNLRFPEGVNYEDWPFHWQLGLRVDGIGHIDRSLVHYRLRKTSITGTGDRKLFDMFAANLLVAGIVDSHDPGPDIRKVLCDKLSGAAWYVIRTVQTRFLFDAIAQTRRYAKATRSFRCIRQEHLKVRMLFTLLALPAPVTFTACFIVRAALNALAGGRRIIALPRKGRVQ